MTLDPQHLVYPNRRAGLDHDWFAHRTMREWPSVVWPGGKPLALCLIVPIEHFPLTGHPGPIRPTGALEPPAPNLWAYSNRDYSARVGVHRILSVLDALGVQATGAFSATAAERYPELVGEWTRRGWEIMAHGLRPDAVHHGGLDAATEADQISQTLAILRRNGAWAVTGWLSPAYSQSFRTLALLARNGIRHVADWANDEMPYRLDGEAAPLFMLPANPEIADRRLLVEQDRTIDDYETVVLKAFDCMAREATQTSGRMLCLSVTPWILGYPHRIGGLRRVLERMMSSGLVWSASAAQIIAAYAEQTVARGPSA